MYAETSPERDRFVFHYQSLLDSGEVSTLAELAGFRCVGRASHLRMPLRGLSDTMPKWVNNGLRVVLTQAKPHVVNPVLLFH